MINNTKFASVAALMVSLFLTHQALSGCVATSQKITPNTIRHRILKIESKVPGSGNPTVELDRIVETAVNEIKSLQLGNISDEESRALRTFETIAKVLRQQGYRYNGRTHPQTLSEALGSRDKLIDCDTGSMIYLSIAERLQLPISMVEIEVPRYYQDRNLGDHNFVRWRLRDGSTVDWDTNDNYRRRKDLETELYGFSWTEDELLGYVYFVRGSTWGKKERVRESYRRP